MNNNKCCCENRIFENVDITPAGSPQRKYFTRCTNCGLVVATYGSDNKFGASKYLRNVGRYLTALAFKIPRQM